MNGRNRPKQKGPKMAYTADNTKVAAALSHMGGTTAKAAFDSAADSFQDLIQTHATAFGSSEMVQLDVEAKFLEALRYLADNAKDASG